MIARAGKVIISLGLWLASIQVVFCVASKRLTKTEALNNILKDSVEQYKSEVVKAGGKW